MRNIYKPKCILNIVDVLFNCAFDEVVIACLGVGLFLYWLVCHGQWCGIIHYY